MVQEKIIIPLDIWREISLAGESGMEVLVIAVANFSYLARIRIFITTRTASAGYKCQIIEKP